MNGHVGLSLLGGQARWQSPISTWFLRTAMSGTSANTLDWHGVPSGYISRIRSKYSGFAGLFLDIFVTRQVPGQRRHRTLFTSLTYIGVVMRQTAVRRESQNTTSLPVVYLGSHQTRGQPPISLESTRSRSHPTTLSRRTRQTTS